MLTIYISFFAGGDINQNCGRKAVVNALGFVFGFTVIFSLFGAFAGAAGSILLKYDLYLNIAAGLIIILFGLNYIGVIKAPFINRTIQVNIKKLNSGFFSAILFGAVFSIGWTPCIGTFLGSALMMAMTEGERVTGVLMLLSYSLGLGIPFILSALLIERFKSAFNFIKRNYRLINKISGGFLIIMGILIATGYMGYFLSLLTF